jgi:hypothetical protein
MNPPTHNCGAEKTKHKADQRTRAAAPFIRLAITNGAEGLAAIAAWLNKSGIPAARANKWQGESVRRMMIRLGGLEDNAPAVRSRSQAQSARQDARRARDQVARAKNAKRRQELIAAGVLKG